MDQMSLDLEDFALSAEDEQLFGVRKQLVGEMVDALELLVGDERIAGEVARDAIATCRQAKLAKFEIPQKLLLVPDEWTVENGLLTAAMKLKREALKSKYGARLTELSNE